MRIQRRDQSCNAPTTDYANYADYEGAAAAVTSYQSVRCPEGGSTSAVVAAAPENRFFLVVPHDGAIEGSYGQDSAGNERSRGANACQPEANSNRCPESPGASSGVISIEFEIRLIGAPIQVSFESRADIADGLPGAKGHYVVVVVDEADHVVETDETDNDVAVFLGR